MTAATSQGRAPAVSISDVSRTFRSGAGSVAALDGLSITVEPGEIVVLLGPSGCGKTTLLRSIAGLEVPDAGEISINGTPVFSTARKIALPPERRGTSMVFQSYALWPHMTVRDNVGYPLRSRKVAKAEVAERVTGALDTVGCGHLIDRFPHQLSGGQQQRIALARAIVAHQGVILFDEPLSNVDAKVRERLRIELLALQRKIGFAAVYVTHDQVEAMIMASRIAVMERGKIVQVGTPAEIYQRPKTHYVADFVGAANFLKGTVEATEGDEVVVRTEIGVAKAPRGESAVQRGDKVEVFFRPEHSRLATSGQEGPNSWRCAVDASLFLGPNYEYVLSAKGQRLLAWTADGVAGASGEVWLSVDPARMRILAESAPAEARPAFR